MPASSMLALFVRTNCVSWRKQTWIVRLLCLSRSRNVIPLRLRLRFTGQLRQLFLFLVRLSSWRLSKTYRAAFGGPLASRELWVGRSCSSRCLPSLWGLVTRVRGRIPFGAPCPQRSMAREASTLSLVTCHAGFSRHGIDPVGETSNVPDTPLGAHCLVVSPPASTGWIHPCSSHK